MEKASPKLRRFTVLALSLLLAVTFLAPGGSAFAAKKLTVKPSKAVLTVGKTKKLTANQKVKWSVSKASAKVVKLSKKSGKVTVVTAKKAGKATVVAKAGKQTKKITITAKKADAVKTASAKTFAAYAAGKDKNKVLVDARVMDAYQGWALGSAKKGGHFKNAVSFPAQTVTAKASLAADEKSTYQDYYKQQLNDAGMTKTKSYVIYDTNGKDAKTVASFLVKEQGFRASGIQVYNATKEINKSKDLVSYPNYDLYVPASVVKNLSDNLVSNTALNSDAKSLVGSSKNIVILDVAWGTEEQSGFLDAHIPGAVHVNTDEFEGAKTYVENKRKDDKVDYRSEWRLLDDATLIKLAGDKGITLDSCVVVTGGEPMATTRMAIILKYLGVKNVHVMSSGMQGWNAGKYKMAKGSNVPKAVSLGTDKPLNPDVIDTIAEVKNELKDTAKYTVVDTRTKEEWNGLSSGYSYHDLAGRIAGTVFSPCGQGYSSSVMKYRNADKSMRTGAALEKYWKSTGVDSSKQMVFFCGSGWRAAETTWDAWILGLKASLYSDGWIAWSNEGNDFIDHTGKTVHFDAATNTVRDANGKDVSDGTNIAGVTAK